MSLHKNVAFERVLARNVGLKLVLALDLIIPWSV